MTAILIREAQQAGIDLHLVDGKVTIVGKPDVLAQWRDKLRAAKPEIIRALAAANDPVQPGTRRPPGLSPKLLAASKALDAQIVSAGGTLDLPQDKPKQAKKEFRNSDENSTAKDAPPKVKREDPYAWLKTDAPWRPLAKAYRLHHINCPACIAAGLNPKYQRCGTGSTLWQIYQSAIE